MLNSKALSFVLAVLVVPATSLAAFAIEGDQVQAFSGETTRTVSRVFYWDQATTSSPGQYSISYGPAKWKAEYDGMLDQLKGKRNRLGSNNWASLDTNIPLSIGGKDVAPGIYFIAIECSKDGNFSLVLLDPKEVMAKKFDAFQAGETKGGIVIPLTYSKSETSAEDLTMTLKRGEVDVKNGKLEIAWGNHKATAAVSVTLKP
jgi:hypothetical protein